MFGPETLAYMLFGMAALKSGYLTGQWSDADYRRAAIRGYAISLPFYLLLVWLIFRSNFSVLGLFAYAMAATVLIRPFMIAAVAALVILLTRKGGWLTQRIAAAGRAAFTNYLGTSILMTGLFYGWGLGLFGELGRAQLWLVVIAMWVVMLAWSKPWLERFQYGPLEWLWRSLARGEIQPMRKKQLRAARGLDPAEALVGDLLAEAAGGRARGFAAGWSPCRTVRSSGSTAGEARPRRGPARRGSGGSRCRSARSARSSRPPPPAARRRTGAIRLSACGPG